MQIGKGDEKAAGAAERKIDQRGRDAARTGDRPGNMKGGKKPLMRSIHKKTLKRFLSTLLALTMVLGMVPFTALAAGAQYAIVVNSPDVIAVNQTVDGSATLKSLTTSATTYAKALVVVTMTSQPPESNPKIIATDLTSGLKYNLASPVEGTLGDGTIGTAGKWGPYDGFQVAAGYAETTDLKLTFDKPGTYTVTFKLVDREHSDAEICSGTKTITVIGFNSLTGPGTNPLPGESFDVTASTTATSGVVQFSYGSQTRTAAVGANGKAAATFTAEAGQTAVVAILSGISGVDAVTTSGTITLGTPATMRTITYAGNAVDANNVPAAETVANGANYAVTTAKPNRTGFTFVGWSTDSTRTAETFDSTNNLSDYDGGDPILSVDSDITLYAVWTKNTVTLTWPALPITGVTSITQVDGSVLETTAPEGSTVTFKVTVTDGYDGSTMVVTANGSPLYGTKGTGNTYIYNFPATAATTVAVAANPTELPVTVKFVRQAADATAANWPADFTVAKGSTSITLPWQTPTMENKEFKGWVTNTAHTTADYAVGASIPTSADLTLYALWANKQVQITYPSSTITGATVAGTSGKVDINSTVTFTVTVATGYDASTLVVTANGVPLAATAVNNNVYTYSFKATADTTIAVTDLAKQQYTITLPYGDSFTAVFTGCKRDGANLTAANNTTAYTFEYGDTFQVKVAPKPGYKLSMTVNGDAAMSNGATPVAITNETGEKTTQSYTVDKDYNISITVDAIKFYTVTYVVDGAQMTTREVEEGTLVKSLANIAVPSKEGYTFGGWYSNTDLTTALASTAATEKVTGDMEVYGKYVPTTATITFNQNGGTGGPTSQTKVYGVPLNLSGLVPTKAGCTFMGWDTDSQAKVAVYQPGDLYSTEGDATLYAVWKINTYTVTLPTGTGYSISTTQSTTVNYGASFTFTVKVDRGYASTIPTVKANTIDCTPSDLTTPATDGSRSYDITIPNITADQVVSVSVTENATYTVTFYTWKNDGTTTEVYQTQQVEDTYKATQPAAPVIEGYTFGGWFTVKAGADFVIGSGSTKNTELDAAYNFDTAVTDNLVVVAKMIPITPQVSWTASGAGWTLTVTSATPTGTYSSPYAVTYNTDVTFTVTISEGYDASNMQVGANGVALAPISIENGVYTYKLTGVKVNTTITVVGVVRKTVTITYNANARDDVSGMPVQQVVKYYLDGADNDTIVKQYPVRTGYEFLGWCTDSAYTGSDAVPSGETYYAKTAIETGAVSTFTKDTTLYAIWEANSTTITLAVSDVAVAAGTGTNAKEYEGQKVTLTATIAAAPSTGSVIFYKRSDDGTAWTVISSQSANGSDKYTFEATTGAYSGTDTYKVAYKAESDEGYDGSESSTVSVDRLSTTITWKLNGDAVDGTVAYGYASTIQIKEGTTVLTPGTAMTAGQTYTLTAPAVYELGAGYATALKVGTDYTITWQYLDGANGWKTLAENQTTSTYEVKSKYSEYQFRALMVVNTGDSTVYTKAAKFADEYKGDLNTTETMGWLISEPTPAVALQQTKTTLAITGADDEAATVKINGANDVFTADHLAQFEGQKVTLEATVTDNATSNGVTVGYVNFYRYVATGDDELLNTTPVEVGANGVATFEVTISDYSTASGQTALTNVDRFYAVYLVNDTYDTSASVTKSGTAYSQPGDKDSVWIKSTAIQTPIITSTLPGKISDAEAYATTYGADLTDLLAGVEHKFTLRTTGAAGVAGQSSDWSVVALDGRTVASTDYTIQWLVTTGSNEEQAPNDATQASFVVNESKNGDKYRVKLIHKGDMTADAFSNYVVINSLQDVTVLVTASDKIDSTTDTDVYQLNDITLTAEVLGKDSQIMKPTGNVTFYYSVNGTNWVEIGTAALKQDDVSRTMKATIVTDKLPVDVDNGYKQEQVTVTAVYAGDETFKASNNRDSSGNVTNDTENNITAGDYVQPDEVTVYSSVVLVHAAEENKAVTSLTNGGIHILANGSLVANETGVALTLQQVYTLDYNIDLSKLVYGTDYTVEWQILENASLYNQSGYYGNTEKWNDIGATGSSYTIGTVPQDAAYRAEITVTNTAPVQGSAQGVQQGAANATTTGRKVYYSNVLVVGAGQATVTTNITTSANTKFNEEGIVAGETVTIHALVAGASNVTPISNLTVTILPQGVTDPALAVFTDELTTVNGYNAFTWDTTGVTPGYYTLTVVATSNNGYAPQTITRTLIVRDNDYTLTVNGNSKVYNGKAQGIDWTLTGIDIENALAQKSVVVYYYDEDGKMVEPTQAGTYNYELYLPASAYWTELTHVTGTFTIEKRTVDVVDLVAQAKVYDGTTDINELEVILNDSAIDGDGAATGETGIINGDSIYATGVMTIDAAGAGNRTLSVSNVTLGGDDANNYTVGSTNYTESINVQRSQVKGDIANSTFQYTGSNITVPADDIILIDQAGNVITSANYTVTYYYHNGDGVEKVDAMNKLGKYTVIARPEQNNYKGGASETIYVVSGTGTDAAPTAPTSALINITNTVELYGAAGNTGIVATATNGATITTIEYQNGTGWTETVPTDAGRYLVKVTTDTNDTAYGIYTIVKANPELELTATGATYTSDQITGTPVLTGAPTGAEVYYTYTGGTIQGVAYEAPTEAGDYVVTAHVGETANYTAHEVSANFTIAKAPLKITADDLARWQYGSYPDMVATFTGLATGGVAADTSLRDVQIQPEFIFNDLNGDGQPEYTNSALDQVGKNYPITVRNALARNYTVTYVAGSYAVNELDPKADLAIHGMIDNGITNPAPVNIAYYGDQIQLYAYGNYKSNGDGTGVYNPSSLLEWSLSAGAPATIDQDGLLTITGVGTFTVTLTRGSGDAAISTSIEITAKPKEVKVDVKDQDKVYNASEQTYNGTVTVEGLINSDTDSATLVAGDKRTNVGSQIVTYKVNTAKYVSETYGGLFTINDKEVTVKPNAASVVYGETLSTLTYTEEGIVTGTPALTNGKAVSIRDSYVNLDVLDGYEILVAGVENMNYNVKYVTDQDAPDAEVTAKPLTFKTGVINSDGRTSGYMKNNSLFYKDEGFAITGETFTTTPVDRMYGEVNPVMDYLFDALIADDSEADLVSLLDWLVKYSDGTAHNINGDANVKFVDAHLTGYKSTAYLTGMDAYYIDGMLAADGVKNYTTTVTEATQNIYQRPVTLTPRVTLTAYKPSIIDGSNNVKQDVLLQLLLNNLVVGEYNGKGGLATLLGHTIEDLNIQIVTATYNGTDKIDVTIKLGNTNYWTNTTTFTVNVDPSKIVATYGPLGWTSASVTMIGVDESGNTTGPVNVTGTVTYLIYAKDTTVTEHKYSHYKNLTPVRSVTMTSGGSTGYYIANYDRLSAGDYVMFAIAEGYTIIE